MRKSVFKESISKGKSFLLLMLLALTLSAATVSATEGGDGTGSGTSTDPPVENQLIQCGDNVYGTLSNGVLTVQGTGSIWNCTSPGASKFVNIKGNIKEIKIYNGITNIGAYAFAETSCEKLTIFGSVQTIEQRAFWGSSALETVEIGGSVKRIGPGAFRECSKLTQFLINASAGTTTIGKYAFNKTPSLQTFNIPTTVTTINEGAFLESGLNTVDIPEKVGTIGNSAFGQVAASIYSTNCKFGTAAFAAGSTLRVIKGSTAETYAKANGITPTYIECSESREGFSVPHAWDAGTVTKASTCKEKGVKTYICTVCNATKTEEIALSAHSYGAWMQTKAPTVSAKGSKRRTCSVCGYIETKSVKKATPVIALNVKKLTLSPGESYKVLVTTKAAGDSVKSWTSTNKKVATVTSGGKVKAKAAGSAKIKVTLKSGISATVKVTVSKVATKELSVTAKNAKLKNGKISIKAHKTFKLVAKVKPSNSSNKVTFSSSKKSIATVNGSGKVTTKKKGTAKITVKSGKKKVTITVKVK